MESKSGYNELISKLNDKGEIVLNMTRTMKNTIQTLQRKGYVYRYGDLVKLTHLIPVGSIKLLKPTYTNYSDYLDKRISSLEVPLNEYESKGITILQHFHLLQRDGYNNMTIQEVIDEIKAVKSMAKEFDFNITRVLYDSLNFVNSLV